MRANYYRKRHRQEAIFLGGRSKSLLSLFLGFLEEFSRPTNSSRRILRECFRKGNFDGLEIRVWRRAQAAMQLIMKIGESMREAETFTEVSQ